MDKYIHPEQAVYKLLEKLYNFDLMEIHKKTEKDAKREVSWIFDRDMGANRFRLFFFYYRRV